MMSKIVVVDIGKVLMLGEVVWCSGVVVLVLYFYEKKGLIYSYWSSGNQCCYSCDVLCCVVVIKVVQWIGILLVEIGWVLVELLDGCIFNVYDWKWLLVYWCYDLNECI